MSDLVPMIGGMACAVGLGIGVVASGADRPLRGEIEALIAGSGARSVAVAYRDLGTGEEILIRADEVFHPASTMKVPVMMEVFRQADEGKLSLDDRIRITNEFASIADGSPYALKSEDDSEKTLYDKVGEEVSIRELVRLMIVASSNLATNLLINRVSAAKTSAFMKDLGAEGVRVLRGVEDGKAHERGLDSETTARGLLTILRLLAERKVVSPGASAAMIEILKGQTFQEGIPAGLPPGTPVAHKTGWIEGRYYHDAGIVLPEGRPPYVLVVLTRGIKDDQRAYRLVADIAKAVHEQATGRAKSQ
jgi:beta-lactamase class A